MEGKGDGTERSALIELRKRLCFALLLAGLLATPGPSFPYQTSSRQAKAASTFARAVRMRTTLEFLPEGKRTKGDYLKIIETFQEVVWLDPAYAKAPTALACVAELYEEMGRLFSSPKYYHKAIESYKFVGSGYPDSQVARDALFTIGEIYSTDLADPESARHSFQVYLEKYPKSAKADEARAKLREIEGASSAPAAAQEALPPNLNPSRHPNGLSEVTALRHWVGPNYSRVVIAVDEEVKFETTRLSRPDRIVLDIENARLSPALLGRTFPAEDGFLRQIRLGQFSSNVTRVVLDVEKLEEYSVLPLPNPFRLVVDIHGQSTSGPQTEQASQETAAPPTATRPPRTEESSSASKRNAGGSETASKAEPAARNTRPKPEGETSKGTEESKTPQPTQAVGTASLAHPQKPAASSETGRKTVETSKAGSAPPVPKAAVPTASGSRTLTRALGLKIGRIVIDPGHGGHDTGTTGPTGLLEKDVVLDVGLRLRKLLEQKAGCEVVMTRSDDTFIPLEERTAIANEKAADLFISIHANASGDRSARGIETYYLNFTSNSEALEVAARENATSQESVHELQDLIKKIAMTEKITESEEFARQLQKEVYHSTSQSSGSQRDRGVKKAPFIVLIGANMPSVLTEISFLSNPRDEKSLRHADYRQKIAEALYQGIQDYVSKLGGVKVVQRAASDKS